MERKKKLTRRGFGAMLAGGAAAARAQAPSRGEELQAARQRRQANAEALAKFDVPIPTEPAFVFKP